MDRSTDIPEACDDEVRPVRLPATSPGPAAPVPATAATETLPGPAAYPSANAANLRESTQKNRYDGFWTPTPGTAAAAGSAQTSQQPQQSSGSGSGNGVHLTPDEDQAPRSFCCGLLRAPRRQKQRKNQGWQVGQQVQTMGLSDQKLNGLVGTVVEFIPDRGRYFVDITTNDNQQRRISVKVENLRDVVSKQAPAPSPEEQLEKERRWRNLANPDVDSRGRPTDASSMGNVL
eukprot:gnl/TRDRNA2_/TRDRNA2_184205_c0_seq1.p1 gnl/TRDRNA2_/TRDRNA2_184205_c0~~gnl/TRDRNA2_/TRDRNA2_184205_c0_seq1.p1  ORF type:complete len:232 (-),score=51.42 gnl/TRDRNA2_/TRDRNA2_184205_c0_seq1:86-781(-)